MADLRQIMLSHSISEDSSLAPGEAGTSSLLLPLFFLGLKQLHALIVQTWTMASGSLKNTATSSDAITSTILQ